MHTQAVPLRFHRFLLNRSSILLRYSVAALAIVVSALLYGAIDRIVDGGSPFLAFTPAVMIAAWFGGLGPGLFATVLGGLIGNFFWVPPLYSFVIVEPHELIHTLVFYAVGIAISLMSRALERARANAVAANGAKDHFLAVLSHELRNPLSAIAAAANALEEADGANGQAHSDLKVIQRNVALQSRLIDDLLDVSRVSHGKILLQLEVCDAHEVLRHAMEVCRSDAERKHLTMQLEPGAAQPFVRADPARLQQIFWNLLRNAIKFTPSGGKITSRTSNRASDQPQGTLTVEVADTGLGIDPADLMRIFEPFEQGSGAAPQRAGGLGLGLALCKSLVDLHGGTIRAASKGVGFGSTFTVELPAVAAPLPLVQTPGTEPNALEGNIDLLSPSHVHTAPAKDLEVDEHSANGDSIRILLVEDDPDSGPLLLRLLRRSGYDVTLASRFDLALREARQRRIDLLISDLSLPDGNGIDLLRAIKSRQPVRGICVSGYGSDIDQEKTRLAGFERHLVKPVSIQALRTAIETPVSS